MLHLQVLHYSEAVEEAASPEGADKRGDGTDTVGAAAESTAVAAKRAGGNGVSEPKRRSARLSAAHE